MIPAVDGPEALMTLQSISGSDVFGPVHWTTSKDLGRTWASPVPIPGLGRRSLGEGWEEGTCDVVPEFHPPTRTVLAVGHNVYYKNGVLARPQRQRWPVYVVRSQDGRWSEPRRLEWDDPRATDDLHLRLLAAGDKGRTATSWSPCRSAPRVARSVRSRPPSALSMARTSAIRRVGDELVNTAGRGLLEPSLVYLDGRYFLTIRAEDGRGHVAASEDGLRWEPQRPWCWDDGEPLAMSTTQQHWLPHSEGLFLVYTRKAERQRRGDPLAGAALRGPGRSEQPAADPGDRAGRPAADRRRDQRPQACGRDGQLPHGRRRAGGVVGDRGRGVPGQRLAGRYPPGPHPLEPPEPPRSGLKPHGLDSGRAVEGVAEGDDAPGIGGLLCLDGDLRDAAGLVQRERRRRLAAERPGELREDVGLWVQSGASRGAGRRW